MNLLITRAETEPTSLTVMRNAEGRKEGELVKASEGSFETPEGVINFTKYFTSDYTQKKRKNLVIFRTPEAPLLDETIKRLNRAASLGERAVRQSEAVFGTDLGSEDLVRIDGGEITSSTDMLFGAEFPLDLKDFAEVPELGVGEDGKGLYWFRLSIGGIAFYADNPDMQERSTLGVFMPTESPDAAAINPASIRWQRADALLTPSTAELPGALGDLSLRTDLIELRPGFRGDS